MTKWLPLPGLLHPDVQTLAATTLLLGDGSIEVSIVDRDGRLVWTSADAQAVGTDLNRRENCSTGLARHQQTGIFMYADVLRLS